MNKTALALIPARGGSKGVPNKNLQKIGGTTLVGRSVISAFQSQRVNRVVVSTDDESIRDAAASHGALTIQRPSELSGDSASSESALIHALDQLDLQGPLEPNIIFMQCTSPFTTGSQIDNVLQALDNPKYNSAFSVVPWHGFLWDLDGTGLNHDADAPRLRRQELTPTYLETGALYAMRTSVFREKLNRFCKPSKPVPIEGSGPDIDTHQDLELCRLLYELGR